MLKVALPVSLCAATLGVLIDRPEERPADLLGDAFGGIALRDTLEEVAAKLADQCDELKRVEIAAPYLPLARKTQTHLIATDVFAAGVDEAAFTFADGRLVQVEARGGAVEGLFATLEGEPLRLADFHAHVEERVVALEAEDAVWFLSADGLHPHLYLWSNPDLPSVPEREQPFAPSAARPDVLAFGETLETLLPRFRKSCPRSDRQEIAQPWLPSAPTSQVQINLYGLEYAGFPRKVEAVFGDDVLQLAWILTGAGEEARVRRALVAAFGEPVFVSKTWEAFDGFRVALRKDKPEVLMVADELVPAYRGQIEATGD